MIPEKLRQMRKEAKTIELCLESGRLKIGTE